MSWLHVARPTITVRILYKLRLGQRLTLEAQVSSYDDGVIA